MIESFAHLKPLESPIELGKLQQLAAEESHGVFKPVTDVIVKGDEIAGYLSVGSLPTSLAWFSKDKLTSRDSFYIINAIETVIARGGGRGVIWPMPNHSPFYSLMERMKYINGGTYDLFYKYF